MSADALLYLGTLAAMTAIFAALAWRAFRKSNKDRVEEPKHRMLKDS